VRFEDLSAIVSVSIRTVLLVEHPIPECRWLIFRVIVQLTEECSYLPPDLSDCIPLYMALKNTAYHLQILCNAKFNAVLCYIPCYILCTYRTQHIYIINYSRISAKAAASNALAKLKKNSLIFLSIILIVNMKICILIPQHYNLNASLSLLYIYCILYFVHTNVVITHVKSTN